MERSSPPPFSAYPIPRSFPFVLPSRRRRPRPDRTAVQRGGGCGVAYVCKSWPGTGGCGTLQPCEYACTRVQRRRPLAIRSCVRLALGVQSGAMLLHSGDRWEIRPCNAPVPLRSPSHPRRRGRGRSPPASPRRRPF